MNQEITIRIAGEAGQGMQTVGSALCVLSKKLGLYVFANQDYMSRIRGGNNYYQVRIGRRPLFTLRSACDVVVALDRESVALHARALSDRGIVAADRAKFGLGDEEGRVFDVPLYQFAQLAGGSELYVNSAAFGVIAGLLRAPESAAQETIAAAFADKGEEIIAQNQTAVREGHRWGRERFGSDVFAVAPLPVRDVLLMNGSDAVALGAIRGGVKFYSAYPMTPSTGIMLTVAHYARDFGIIVEQAEDEIAAINMVIGASYAGVRAMTGTSGGGFALMVEGISLAGMTETPVVVVNAQRPAPATGFPTRTEQADLDFVLYSGHGEFARAVFAPGTPEEAFEVTVRALNLAERFQVPVIILTDQHLADSYRDIEPFDLSRAKVERQIITKEESAAVSGYKRYALTETGISPRAIPSWIKDPVYLDSDEHTEEGHITEDASIRAAMVHKRFHKKMAGLRAAALRPTALGTEGAETVLVGFGSTWGVMKEAAEALAQKMKLGVLHFSQVYPLPLDELTALSRSGVKLYTVENNAGAQLAGLIRRESGIGVAGSILKYDGRPFDLDGLVARVSEVASHG